MVRKISMLGLIFALFGIFNVGLASANTDTSQEKTYLVKFKSSANVNSELKEIKMSGGKVEAKFKEIKNTAAVKLNDSELSDLKDDSAVQLIEENKIFTVDGTVSNPPDWGQDRIDQRNLPLDSSYSYPLDGTGVTIYIADTGIRSDHIDFTGRIVEGFDGIEDGNGIEDCHGHGTHVAGSAAGTRTGVANNAMISPVRVLGCDGYGSTLGIMHAVDWMVEDHVSGRPAVANFSLGGGASSFFDSLLQDLVDDGITVVTSAGNDDTNACSQSPARRPSAITVGSTDRYDDRSYFSNWGPCVDVFAPGSSIVSSYYSSSTALAIMSGTSMASPHTAGVAATILQSDPGMSPAQVEARIISRATLNVLSDVKAGSPNRLLYVPQTAEEPVSRAGISGGITTDAFN